MIKPNVQRRSFSGTILKIHMLPNTMTSPSPFVVLFPFLVYVFSLYNLHANLIGNLISDIDVEEKEHHLFSPKEAQ